MIKQDTFPGPEACENFWCWADDDEWRKSREEDKRSVFERLEARGASCQASYVDPNGRPGIVAWAPK